MPLRLALIEMRELAELATRRGGSCEVEEAGGEGAGELDPAAERTLRLNSSLSSDMTVEEKEVRP